MLRIWGRVSSSNVQAVMWCISELGLEYDRTDAGLMYGVNDTADYLALNPNGTVPTLQDADNPPIWESGAILRYLSNVYAEGEFWPADPVERTRVDMWAEWSKLNIALKFTAPVFWRVVRTPPSRRSPGAIREAVATVEKFLAIADNRLAKQEFIAGDHFSMADIQFGHCLYRYFHIDIERQEFANLERYYAALTNRKPYAEHVMVSYEELRETD